MLLSMLLVVACAATEFVPDSCAQQGVGWLGGGLAAVSIETECIRENPKYNDVHRLTFKPSF